MGGLISKRKEEPEARRPANSSELKPQSRPNRFNTQIPNKPAPSLQVPVVGRV